MRVLLIFIVLFISCNNNRKVENIPFVENKKETKDTVFEYKYTNEPKIFLKFWKGMNYSQYSRVCDSLKKEGILDGEVYKTDDCKIKIEPNFINESLYSIYFVNNVDCIYELYVEKYKIPQMIEKSSLIYYYRENNPSYSPKYFYETEGIKKELPNCFDDKSNFIKDKIKLNTEVDWAYEKFLPKDILIIENGDVVIKIKQKISESLGNKYGYYKYSIEENQDYKDFITTPEGIETSDTFSAYNGKSLGEYIVSNSKTRTTYGTISPSITIEYLMKKDYLQELEKLKVEQSEKENKKDLKNQRRYQVKDEI